jgi:uncharacterized protein YukJ
MPVQRYGVLKGRGADAKAETGGDSPHYQVRIDGGDTDYRIAVNVKSVGMPAELLYLVDDNFRHPVTTGLRALPDGFTALASRPDSGALDFIRGNLFNRRDMKPLPHNVPGPDNDLNEKVDFQVRRARRDPAARIYAFGARWGPEDAPDKIFHFAPGNGIHDIHMNQGNDRKHRGDDGVWQDGALLLQFPGEDRWVAIFLAFGSQAWHTDDRTGHRIVGVEPDTEPVPRPLPEPVPAGPAHEPAEGEPDFLIRIVAALVNPVGPAPEAETVTLLNTSPDPIDLAGWTLLDRMKQRQALTGTIAAGAAKAVKVGPPFALGNNGGIITLLDSRGLKVDGVSYTAVEARREGWTIAF